jgi:hypothetical protein
MPITLVVVVVVVVELFSLHSLTMLQAQTLVTPFLLVQEAMAEQLEQQIQVEEQTVTLVARLPLVAW